MNNFVELSNEELLSIDGGSWGSVAIGAVITVAGIAATVASCGTAIPAWGAVLTGISIVGGCATTTYGIMSEIK